MSFGGSIVTDLTSWASTLVHFFEQGLEIEDVTDKGYPKSWVMKAYQLYLENSYRGNEEQPPYEYLELD